MRNINMIVVHCSATKEEKDFRASDIRNWHKAQGYSDIGYHFVVQLDGTVEKGRTLDKAGAHAKGHNSNSIGICYIGGLDTKGNFADTRTEDQKQSLTALIEGLVKEYPAINRIVGHRDLGVNKACPCFDAVTEYSHFLNNRR